MSFYSFIHLLQPEEFYSFNSIGFISSTYTIFYVDYEEDPYKNLEPEK